MKPAADSIRRLFARLRPELHEQRWLVAGSALALVGESLVRLVEPWPIKWVVDRVVEGSATQAVDPLLFACALALVLAAGARALLGHWSVVGFARAGSVVLISARRRLFQHLQTLSPRSIGDARRGDLLLRVVGDVSVVREALITAAVPLVASCLLFVGAVGVLLWVNVGLTLAALAPLPLTAAFVLNRSRRIRSVGRGQRNREGELAATASESLEALSVVQSLSAESHFSEAFEGANRRDLKSGVQGKRLSSALERGVHVQIAVSSAIALVMGGHLVLAGTLGAGDLVLFVTLLRRGFRPVRNLAKHTARLAKALAASERVLEVWDREPDVLERPDAIPAPPLRHEIRFEDVSVRHSDGRSALSGLRLQLAAGSRVALVGPSGSGKSTLLSLLLRLEDPDEGVVTIDGADLRTLQLESLRHSTSLLIQDPLLFRGTLRDNLALGGGDPDDIQLRAALERVGALPFLESLPDGLDTLVGERGAKLSRGQRQLVAVARASLRETSLLLLDEPTTGLDGQTREEVRAALLRLSRGRTTLWATHHLEEAMECDLVVVLERGRVVEIGEPSVLAVSGGFLTRAARQPASSRDRGAELAQLG